ncbi:MAG TPA: DUF6167 family protein [Nocardioidaceae bacterium]
MSRTLWFVAGAATSAYAIVKARRAAEALTPEGMRDRLAGLSLGAQLFGEELRTEMAARETDLRERLGLGLDGTPQIGAAPASHLQLTREGSN